MKLQRDLRQIDAVLRTNPGEKIKRRKRLKFAVILTVFLILSGILVFFKDFQKITINFNNNDSLLIRPIPEMSLNLKIQQELNQIGIKVKEIEEDTKDIYVTTDQNIIIILDKQKEIERQVTSLQLIIRRFTIEGKRLKKIDLRFTNPIIQ